jgi:hypothetical protein
LWNLLKAAWDEAKHPRDQQGRFRGAGRYAKAPPTSLKPPRKTVWDVATMRRLGTVTWEAGQEVRLRANVEEGWQEEYGRILEVGPKVITVEVHKPWRQGKEDDGLREVTPDQLELTMSSRSKPRRRR